MKYFILIFMIYFSELLLAQNEWVIYDTSNGLPGNEVSSIAIDNKGNKWIGTYYNGLAKYNLDSWEVYNENAITSMAFEDNIIWINEYWGIASFDGSSWTKYKYSIENIDNYITFLAVDKHGYKWIGTKYGDIFKFNDTTWIKFNMPFNNRTVITSISIDSNNNIWIGSQIGLAKLVDENWTNYDISACMIAVEDGSIIWVAGEDGIAKFDGTNWTIYDENKFSFYSITSFAIDKNNCKWIGTYDGLYKFDGTIWTVYYQNDGLPNSRVTSIAIDSNNYKWIGTGAGLAVYKGDGIVSVDKVDKNIISITLPNQISLSQNYPNPFNPSTTIKYQIANYGFVNIKVYDILGSEIATLVNKVQNRGNYEITFNAENLSNGIYYYQLNTENFVQTKKMVLIK